jgi:hypothetical protein
MRWKNAMREIAVPIFAIVSWVLFIVWIGFDGLTLSLDPIDKVKVELLFLVVAMVFFLRPCAVQG